MKDASNGLGRSNASLPTFQIQENVSLEPYHSFGLQANARYFCELNSETALRDLMLDSCFVDNKRLFLGGGTNTLFMKDFPGLVVKLDLRGIKKISDNKGRVNVRVSAGENWHHFVQYSLSQGWYGLENLSLIPGTVGASPIQNIGAYGVEVKDFISHVETVHILSAEKRIFTNEECEFSYRNSRFKRDLKGQYVIVAVHFSLKINPEINLDYADLKERLHESGIIYPSPQNVSAVVCKIRSEKLPDPALIGNAGSFFKNPIVDVSEYRRLMEKFPELVGFRVDKDRYKISAGWLIEYCGFKGQTIRSIGIYSRQALVLINQGNARGADVVNVIQKITEKVYETFKVHLEVEPELI